MKFLVFILSLIFPLFVSAQFSGEVCSFSINNTPTYGAKIKTNLTFAQGVAMPTLMIEGYDYYTSSPIHLTLVWYVFGNDFARYSVASAGGVNPPVTLANENGKVSIFLDYKGLYMRFNVRAFARGIPGETAANFSGWTVVDSALIPSATGIVSVPYRNNFAGNVYLPDSVTSSVDGKFGIGTLIPRASLDVAGTLNDTLTSVLARLASSNSTGKGTFIGTRSYSATGTNAPMFGLVAAYGGKENCKIIFNKGNGSNGDYLTFHTNDGSEQMRIDKNGNVGIGTTNPGSFKLAVEGTVGARRLICKVAAWADFVFQSQYQLPTLYEVEKYISNNHHLPDIPAASEVLENGIDVAEMNKLLLQKVEELTLYLIEEHKSNDALKRDNDALKKDNEELKNNVKRIMEMLSLPKDNTTK